MRHALDLFRFSGRVTRRQYVVVGVLLATLKYPLDLLVSTAFHQPWSPLMYVSPRLSPLFWTEIPRAYPIALLALSLPFICVGVALSARRLRDVGVDPFWAGLFFLPFLRYPFFIALAVAPSRRDEPAPVPGDGPFRATSAPPPRLSPPLGRLLPTSEGPALLLGVVLSLAIGLGCYVVLAQVSQSLGVGLFVGAPFGMSFATAFVATRGAGATRGTAIVYGLVPIAVATMVTIALAWEGVACIVMASPLLVGVGVLGAIAGHAAGRVGQQAVAAMGLLVTPLLVAVDLAKPPAPAPRSVVSEVTIHAPPSVVWKSVIAFPPIDEPPSPWFAIVAMPLEARIEGHDPGALRRCVFTNGEFEEPIDQGGTFPSPLVGHSPTSLPPPRAPRACEPFDPNHPYTRRCVFTNGEFEEPIEVWDEPRLLRFGVRKQPAAIGEYIDVKRGEFRLRDNHDGTTTLVGTTWYDVRIAPVAYWERWTGPLLHRIHLRVLEHIRHLAERPAAPSLAGDTATQHTITASQQPAWMQAANLTCACTRHASGH